MTPMEWWLPSGAGDSGCIEGALGAQPEALQFLNEGPFCDSGGLFVCADYVGQQGLSCFDRWHHC